MIIVNYFILILKSYFHNPAKEGTPKNVVALSLTQQIQYGSQIITEITKNRFLSVYSKLHTITAIKEFIQRLKSHMRLRIVAQFLNGHQYVQLSMVETANYHLYNYLIIYFLDH